MKPKSELKIAILSEVYMEGKEIKQFLYEHNLGYGRTFYYARNELYEELAVRVFGIYALIEQPALNVIIDKKPFKLDPINFKIWNETYLNGNIMIIIMSSCIFAAFLFLIGGIIKECKKKDG